MIALSHVSNASHVETIVSHNLLLHIISNTKHQLAQNTMPSLLLKCTINLNDKQIWEKFQILLLLYSIADNSGSRPAINTQQDQEFDSTRELFNIASRIDNAESVLVDYVQTLTDPKALMSKKT